MWRLALATIALAAISPCTPCRAAAKPGDVRVLLFQTEAVQRIHLRSSSAALRFCKGCKAQQGPVSLDLTRDGSALRGAGNSALREVFLDGEAEITTAGGHHAQAAGRWRVDAGKDTILVSVVLPRERYVEAVLAAESAPAEPAEALKALAVVARSFAAATAPRHEGGALCDTTHCQALRLDRVSAAVRDAVWSTSGETLWLGANRVPAYFSQHCGGTTADAAEAWGGPQRPWLQAHLDRWCARIPSQWRAAISEVDLRLALASEGVSIPAKVQDVQAARRDRSGRVVQVRLLTTGGERIVPASTVRFALNRSFGWAQLRSDLYQVRRQGDRILFEGQGHGHGVGLCQAGAAVMARAGKGYHDILREYFTGTEVRVSLGDSGWISQQELGFTLRSVSRDADLERNARAAFLEAQSRWNGTLPQGLTLTVAPSTEDFRQATGTPGWNLAVAHGARIVTQPVIVLRRQGDTTPTLRHEFLHTFVENAAGSQAPLWLREGFVEVLNGETCPARVIAEPASLNERLLHPASLVEARRAHEEACADVRKLIAQRGFAQVRAMLQQH